MISLRSQSAGVTIVGLDKAGDTYFRASGEPHTTIPDYEIAADPQVAALHITVGNPQFTSDVDRHYYEYAYDRPEPYQHILWMTGPILERCHQEVNRFSIHSSAFAINDKGVLIVGDTNSGKTSTLLTAVLVRGHAAISGERSLVTAASILGGTRLINVFSGHALTLPALRPFLPGCPLGWKKEHRLRLRLADLGPVTNAATLSAIVFATVTRGSPVERIEWTPLKASMELYRKLTEQIRAASTLMFDKSAGFPSLDSIDLSRSRMLAARTIVERTRVLVLRGTPEAILDCVEEQVS